MNAPPSQIVLGILCLVGLSVASHGQSPTTSEAPDYELVTSRTSELAAQGRRLTPEEAQRLEDRLAADPDDLETRTKLIGYYDSDFAPASLGQSRATRNQHILWIIQHRPESEVAGSSHAQFYPSILSDMYVRGKKLWLKHVEEHADNAAILENAANYFDFSEPRLAQEIYWRLDALQPDRLKWDREIQILRKLPEWRFVDEDDPNMARRAYDIYEQAVQRASSMSTRYLLLRATAWHALRAGVLDKAERYARELLDTAVVAEDPSWNFDNAIHYGHLVLGHIALRRGDVEKAEAHLLKAGTLPPLTTPRIAVSGPNMLLARELLEKKRSKAVIQYLRRCRVFWRQTWTIDSWIKTIESGGTPDFSDYLRH